MLSSSRDIGEIPPMAPRIVAGLTIGFDIAFLGVTLLLSLVSGKGTSD